MYFNFSIQLTKVYNYFTFIMTCHFHPYDITQFVRLKHFVLNSMLPDVKFVSLVFMLLMFAWNKFSDLYF